MKVALCHLELSNGPEQKNIELLEKAVRIAAEKGANWVITPETAVQGYYFYKLEPETKVDKQPSSKLSFLLSLVKDYGLFLFLGCGFGKFLGLWILIYGMWMMRTREVSCGEQGLSFRLVILSV